MFVLFNTLFRKKEEKCQPQGGPYRMPAEMPPPIPDPPKPKPKRQFKFKMPAVNPSKTTKVFMCILAIGACLIGMGLLYDAPLLGLGFKWGTGGALGVLAVFFAVKVFVIIDDKE